MGAAGEADLHGGAPVLEGEGCGDRHGELAVGGELRADISAEDIAASLLGIFGVAGKPGQRAQANRLLNLLMDGLRPRLPSAKARGRLALGSAYESLRAGPG
ncbi:MAG TPA: hypothetical protein VF482_21090 [Trebonia sp.]